MGFAIFRTLVLLGGSALGWPGSAGSADIPDAGVFIGVQGTVLMQPATLTAPQPVRAYESIGPLATIETRGGSRAKALFADDTLITLSENSRLEITEQTYRAGSETRAFVAHLTRGAARVLVGKPLIGDNSVFELHSKTAVATVRGTYFVLWIQEGPRQGRAAKPSPPVELEDQEGPTGIANIGQSGDIAFTSGGATVLVLPGQSSVALPGGPPSMPVGIAAQLAGPGPVADAVAGTELANALKPESTRDALAAVGAESGGAVSQPAGMAGAVGGQSSAGAYTVPGWTMPVTPVTPPAVVSGAAPASVNPAAGTSVNLSIRTP